MKKLIRVSIWLLVLFVLVGLIVVAMRPQPILVDVAVAQRGSMKVTIDEDGLTRIRERYVVSTPLAGRLERVKLEAGDEVTANVTVLARMQANDPSLLDPRAIAQAKARVAAAEHRLEAARADKKKADSAEEFAKLVLDRVEQLEETKVLSETDMEAKEMEYRMRHEEARSASFNVEIAEYELELQKAALLLTDPEAESKSPGEVEMELSIKAPINGRVLRVYQESAAVLEAGASLLEVGDPRDIEVVVDVLSNDAVKIRPGQRVVLENWGGTQTLDGEVRVVEPSGFTKFSALGVEEQRVNVIVDLVVPREQHQFLGDGFRVDARVVIWESKDVLYVPTSSLFRTDGEWTLFRVTDESKVEQLKVQIGRNNGIEAEVLDGVKSGDTVVRHPSDTLEDGVSVALRE